MNLQYITDAHGQATGVFIPVKDWNMLIKNFEGLEEMCLDVPEWQKKINTIRLNDYFNNPELSIDFEKACDDIEYEIGL